MEEFLHHPGIYKSPMKNWDTLRRISNFCCFLFFKGVVVLNELWSNHDCERRGSGLLESTDANYSFLDRLEKFQQTPFSLTPVTPKYKYCMKGFPNHKQVGR